MPIGIGEDHEELRRTVRRWLEARCPPEVRAPCSTPRPRPCRRSGTSWPVRGGWASTWPRSTAARASACSSSPWSSRRWRGRDAGPGGLHHARRRGGGGRGGRPATQGAATGHGPTAALPLRWPCPGPEPDGQARRAGSLDVDGEVGPVLGCHPGQADPGPGHRRGRRRRGWRCRVVCRRPRRPRVSAAPLASLDPIRRVGTVRVEGLVVVPERQLPSVSSTAVRDLALVLARPSVPAGRGGVSTSGRPTPSNAASSGVPSASSRLSSTAWRTCWWRWSR